MGSVHKQGWGDWPLCKTHNCSINDGAACKHGLFSQSHDSFSHTVEFSLLRVRPCLCFLMALWFLLYSVHDYICVCSASETCHLQVIECIQLFTWLNFCIRFIPSSFLCINKTRVHLWYRVSSVRLPSSQSKQSYQCCTQTELAQRSVTHRALLRDKHAAVPRLFVFVQAAHGAFILLFVMASKNACSSFFHFKSSL